MLYLMMSNTTDGKLVKVGTSRDLKKRRQVYKSHNPLAIMRSSCAGTEESEFEAHEILSNIGKRIVGTEWFFVSETIFETLYLQGMGYFFSNKKIYFDESYESD